MSTGFESIISQIVSDAPNGEIKEVYQDLITIAGENAKDSILEAIEKYNVENTIPVEIDNHNNVIVSAYNREGSKFFDPFQSIIFSVDHLNCKGLDVEPYQGVTLTDTQREYLEELNKYAGKDFTGDVSVAAYPIPQEEFKTAIIIVSTKYNPANFWNGTWKSEYIYDQQSKQLKGFIHVQVHYYEDGNVSFKSKKDIDIPNSESPIKSIQQVETDFENNLDASFTELNEKQFKQLRRKLPITRSRVNWGKAIGNYRLGRDAAQGSKPL